MESKITPHEIEWDGAKVELFWDYVSKNEYLSSLYFTKLVGNYVLRYMFKNINIKNDKFDILDYGCGPGYLLDHIVDSSIHVSYYGLDFSNDSIEELKAKHSQTPQLKETFYVKDTPFSINRKFDLILAFEVVEHLTDHYLNSMMEEVKKLINDSGIIFITTPNDENLEASKVMCPESGAIFHKWQHVRSWNTKSIKEYMESQGFQTLKVDTLTFGNPLKVFLKALAFKLIGKPYKPANLVYIGKKRK